MSDAIAQHADGSFTPVTAKLAMARTRFDEARAALASKTASTTRIANYVQLAGAGYAFLANLRHGVFLALLSAGFAYVVLYIVRLIIPVITAAEIRSRNAAASQLGTDTKAEVEAFLEAKGGRYQWVRPGDEYLGVLPDTGHVYHMGGASRWTHLLMAPAAVAQVVVTHKADVRETTTSNTTHGRRAVFMPTATFGVVGKGKSTTTTSTQTTVTHSYRVEIQYQLERGATPFWISIGFGADQRLAENWKLLIEQARQQVC